jgi:triosephosphate isomerase (TIM)
VNKLILGNWKMNGDFASNATLLNTLTTEWAARQSAPVCDLGVCVPSVYIPQVQSLLARSTIKWGGQDVSAHDKGAYTGEISAGMLREFGCRYVLVGHSERRQFHAETDAMVAAKAQRALSYGVTPVVCVGETLQERESGQTMNVVKRQLAAVISAVGHCVSELVVAYEPVWAIGTGKTASPEQAQEVHAVLHAQLLAATGKGGYLPRLLYGGSMNASNAVDLLAQPNINGGLIGGASLKAIDFLTIAQAASSV